MPRSLLPCARAVNGEGAPKVERHTPFGYCADAGGLDRPRSRVGRGLVPPPRLSFVRRDEDLRHVVEYVVDNPVPAMWVATRQDYPFSGSPAFDG